MDTLLILFGRLCAVDREKTWPQNGLAFREIHEGLMHTVDDYFDNTTPWRSEALRLREIMLDAGLDEAIKWGKPCFNHGGKNVAIIQEMNDFVALLFMKGVLIDDPNGRLSAPGENSQTARRACFTSVEEVNALESEIRSFAAQAIALEKSGKAVPKHELVLAEELLAAFSANPDLKDAFEALTPGRQREYNIHFTGAKQSSTRAARIEKASGQILAGKGLRDA